jgi:hypothetical protein
MTVVKPPLKISKRVRALGFLANLELMKQFVMSKFLQIAVSNSCHL